MKKTALNYIRALGGLVLLMGLAAGMAFPDDNTNASPAPDQTQNNYYWQGTQLYNLGRLGEAFDSFEKAIQRKQNAKESEAYLLQIRQEIVNNAKNRGQDKGMLNYGATAPENALNITYVDKGYVKVTLQAKYLFDGNTSAIKLSAVDTLDRLAELLQTRTGDRIELTMLDELDGSAPEAKDVDAERALAVFAYLNFKRVNSSSMTSG